MPCSTHLIGMHCSLAFHLRPDFLINSASTKDSEWILWASRVFDDNPKLSMFFSRLAHILLALLIFVLQTLQLLRPFLRLLMLWQEIISSLLEILQFLSSIFFVLVHHFPLHFCERIDPSSPSYHLTTTTLSVDAACLCLPCTESSLDTFDISILSTRSSPSSSDSTNNLFHHQW